MTESDFAVSMTLQSKQLRSVNLLNFQNFICRMQGWASVLFKGTFSSLRSFPFFIKERSVLSVLFRSFPNLTNQTLT